MTMMLSALNLSISHRRNANRNGMAGFEAAIPFQLDAHGDVESLTDGAGDVAVLGAAIADNVGFRTDSEKIVEAARTNAQCKHDGVAGQQRVFACVY